MPPLTRDVVPDHFPAGTTVKFTRSLDDYQPSDGWSYTIYLNGLTQKFSKAATVLSNIFQIQFDPADTASLLPGAFRYAERLTKPATVFTLTEVSSDGQGNAVYSFSGYIGPAPQQGMNVNVESFTNGGNNIGGEITALVGTTSGTFVLVNAGVVDETAAATATIPAEIHDIRGDELVINIEPNVETAAAGTFNTFEEAQLAVIESVLAGRITSGIENYQIAGRSVTKIPIKELLCIRGTLRAAVWRQNNPGRLGEPYKVQFNLENEDQNYPPTWQDITGLDR
jgi:hypothetical protein